MKQHRLCVRCRRRIDRRIGRRLQKRVRSGRKGHFWDRLCARCQLAIRNR